MLYTNIIVHNIRRFIFFVLHKNGNNYDNNYLITIIKLSAKADVCLNFCFALVGEACLFSPAVLNYSLVLKRKINKIIIIIII